MKATDPTRVSVLGTAALLFEAPGARALLESAAAYLGAGPPGRRASWPEIREAVPGVNNLMLTFDCRPARSGSLQARAP